MTKERVLFAEVDQPFCNNIYATAPCAAVLGTTGNIKCFNTRSTCQSPANYDQESYVKLPGSTNNYAYVPDVAFLRAGASTTSTGITIIARAQMNDWTPAADATIGGKWLASGSNESFRMQILTTGKLRLGLCMNGHLLENYDSSVATGVADGTWKWLKITCVFNTGGNKVVKFWLSDDGISWSQLGSTSTTAATANYLLATFAWIEVGSHEFGANGLWAGKVGFFEVQEGVDAFDVRCRLDAREGKANGALTWVSTLEGETWTINQSGSPAATLVIGYVIIRLALRQDQLWAQYDAIPNITAVSTTPAAINLGGMDKSSVAALGAREVVNIKAENHLHSDANVDKYRLERLSGVAQSSGIGYNPIDGGTFWGKWVARNPYAQGYPLRVYNGEFGQALSAMNVRQYVLDRVDGPSAGVVTLTAKDKFSRIEAQKAVAPKASKGSLSADMTNVATTLTLVPSGIGNSDYGPAEVRIFGTTGSGYVAVGDEIMSYTRSADVLTVTRGVLNTTAVAHKQEDAVQVVLPYIALRGVTIALDLMLKYGAMQPGDIDTGAWAAGAVELTEQFTAYIATPTPVLDLVTELAEQAGFTLVPNFTTGRLDFVALRSANPTAVLDDNAWFVEDTLKATRHMEKRASQVHVYYAVINVLNDLTDKRNYRSRVIRADLAAESPDQYGQAAIKEVFSRWIPQFGGTLASNVGDRIITMFRDGTVETTFDLHADRDGSLSLARYVTLATADLENVTGAPASPMHAVISKDRADDRLHITTQSVFFNTNVGDPNNRIINIDSDGNNLNLRTIHDQLYALPTGSETITFIVFNGVKIGSGSTSTPAMDVGTWPAGCTVKIINNGRIQGCGGRGGNTGAAAAPGGPALQTTRALSVDNANGQLWAGGGGGASSGPYGFSGGVFSVWGGGGSGILAGQPGSNVGTNPANAPAAAGTSEAGGIGADNQPIVGIGGTGGGPGLAGGTVTGTGAGNGGINASGAAGNYIVGNAFVTWIANGDRRGGVA